MFHVARGRQYGEAYGPGDTIACYISLPSSGSDAAANEEAVREDAHSSTEAEAHMKTPHPKGATVNFDLCKAAGGQECYALHMVTTLAAGGTLAVHPGSWIAFAKNGRFLGKVEMAHSPRRRLGC